MTAPAVAAVSVVLLGAALRSALIGRRRSRSAHRLRDLAGPDRRAARGAGSRRVPGWLRGALDDADVEIEPLVAWRLWLGAGAGAIAGGFVLGGPVPAALAALAAVVVPVGLLRANRGRALARLEGDLPAALEEVARSLRSGGSLRQALAESATVTPRVLGADLRRVVREADHGSSLVSALERWAQQRPLRGVRLSVAALALGAETGGAQARAIDGVASTLRDQLAVTADVRAQSAQVRASVLVIALAPLAFCAFASATDPRTSEFLFRTPLGWAFVAVGLSLDGVSVLWMRRLARVTT